MTKIFNSRSTTHDRFHSGKILLASICICTFRDSSKKTFIGYHYKNSLSSRITQYYALKSSILMYQAVWNDRQRRWFKSIEKLSSFLPLYLTLQNKTGKWANKAWVDVLIQKNCSVENIDFGNCINKFSIWTSSTSLRSEVFFQLCEIPSTIWVKLSKCSYVLAYFPIQLPLCCD
jgi:hypothetical protein